MQSYVAKLSFILLLFYFAYILFCFAFRKLAKRRKNSGYASSYETGKK